MFDSLKDSWPLNIIGFFSFVIVPFFISVVLPAIFIPRLGLRVFKQKSNKEILRAFSILVIIFAIIATFIWEKDIFNVKYYEWDRGFISYSLTTHETPDIGTKPILSDGKLQGEGSWIKSDTGFTGLTFIWLGITYSIYFISGFVTWLLYKKNEKAEKIIIISTLSLSLFSLPFVIPFLSLLVYLPSIALGGLTSTVLRPVGLVH